MVALVVEAADARAVFGGVAGVGRRNLLRVGRDGDVVLTGRVVGLLGGIAAEDEVGKVEGGCWGCRSAR